MPKTRTEMQLQAYGGFQHSLRKMTREDQEQYSCQGTPERARYEARRAEVERILKAREREINRFMETEPHFGITANLSDADIAAIAKTKKEWEESRKRFMKDLDKRYPKPEVKWDGMDSRGRGGAGKPRGDLY